MTTHPTTIQRYQVVRRLAQGGMGALYLAWDPALKRQVAIKVLMHDDDELRERFAREAQSAASLDHPHIVTVYDVGEVDGRPFIAMEYIRGETLAEIIRNKKALSVTRKLALIEELCSGLHFAHRAGIVHRDVKPSNAIVDDQGSLKVLDFGIARIAESSGMTQAGMLVGTLNYISPEQMVGQPADSRSDIFSVGVVAYELLAYRQAFPGGLESGVLNKILQAKPDPPLEIACPDLDLEIVKIVEHALEKQPADRYQSLDVMERELRRVRRRLETGSHPVADTRTMSVPRRVDREEIARRRASQIQSHLDGARKAIDSSDFESAVVKCEEVLLLDPEQAEAMEILDRARAAIDERQAEEWLNDAEGQFRVGALSAAQALVDRALAVDPTSSRGTSIRHAVEAAVREREGLRRRTDAIKGGLDRAHMNFDRGLFQEAIAAADEVLALEPGSVDAQAVKARSAEAMAGREREAIERRARETVREAQRLFNGGSHAQALEILQRFEPQHELVSNTLATLRPEAERIAEERRLEAERRARQARISTELSTIRAEMARREFASALEHLRRLEQKEESTPEITLLIQESEAGIAREKAAKIARDIDELIRSSAALLDRHDFDGASAKVEAALKLDARSQSALAQQSRIQGARQAEVERREAERREAARLEAERQESARRDAERKDAARREAERKEAERREAERKEAERREAERVAALKREAEQKEAEKRAAAKRESERKEAARREAEQREAARVAALKREAEQKEAEQRAAAKREAERQEATRREAERQEAARKAERLAAQEATQHQADQPTALLERDRAAKGAAHDMVPAAAAEDRTIIRAPDDRTIIRPPDDRTIVRTPDDRTIVQNPGDRTIVRSPDDPTIVRVPDDRTIVRWPAAPVGSSRTSDAARQEELSPTIVVPPRPPVAGPAPTPAPAPVPAPAGSVSTPSASPIPPAGPKPGGIQPWWIGAAAAAAVVLLLVGVGLYLRSGPATTGSNTTSRPQPPPQTAPPPLSPLERSLSQAEDQLAKGQLPEASRSATEAMKQNPSDERPKKLLERILTEAKKLVDQSRQSAREADPRKFSSNKSVAEAERAARDEERAERQGDTSGAIQVSLKRVELFAKARQELAPQGAKKEPDKPVGPGRGGTDSATAAQRQRETDLAAAAEKQREADLAAAAQKQREADLAAAQKQREADQAATAQKQREADQAAAAQKQREADLAAAQKQREADQAAAVQRQRDAAQAATVQRRADEAAVREVVRQYAAAYTGLSAEGVKKVFPDADEGMLAKTFQQFRLQRVTATITDITFQTLTSATVTATWSVHFEPKAGRPSDRESSIRLTLRKAGTSWLIAGRQG
jgi:eukaryotic-like serine/threonine-protein kinase